jgi:membrane associated rhomboid family serine protease
MGSMPSAEENTPRVLSSTAAARSPFHWRPGGSEPLPYLTLAVIAVSVIATLFSFAYRAETHAILSPQGAELWQQWKWHTLITSTFLHGDILHLVFNCYWTWIFGRVLESRLGRLRFLLLFLVTAWVSAVGQLAWSGNPGIGLSGVGYGLFGFLWVARKGNPAFASVITNGVIGLFCSWLLICVLLTETNVKAIGNAAHIMGLASGALAGWAWARSPSVALARGSLVALTMISFVPMFWAPWQDGWCAAKASDAMLKRDFDATLHWCAQIGPGTFDDWARKMEASVRDYRSKTAKHRSELLKLAEGSSDANVLNSVAWQLATSSHDAVRDGAQALAYATRACELDGWKNPAYLDTLAAAHAEVGNFQEAETWMQRALQNPQEHAGILKKHLEFFRSRKPWREP